MLQCLGVLSSLGSGSVSDKPTYQELRQMHRRVVWDFPVTQHLSSGNWLCYVTGRVIDVRRVCILSSSGISSK
jgi:hypothetical protein